MIRAFILDMDNTIYPVKSIGYKLFAPLFELMDQYKDQVGEDELKQAKEEVMSKPLQGVADKHHFPKELKDKCVQMLSNLTYDEPMQPFDEYEYVRSLPFDKFLVTAGFMKMQQKKVEMLGLSNDFKKIYIIDPETTDKTKKDIFEEIAKEFNYKPEELLVIGDDADSEIKYGKMLGMKTFLYDPENNYPDAPADVKAKSFEELRLVIS